MILKLLIYALAFSSANIFQPQMIDSHEVDERPTYFFKPSADGRYLAYTTWQPQMGFSERNIILDTHTNQRLLVPGYFDPIFALNSELVIIPNNVEGTRFYLFSDLQNEGRAAQPLLYDQDLRGVYESVGILEKNSNQITYRLILEFSGRYYRDYLATTKGGKTTVLPVGEVKVLCNKHKFSLPMISKNGREVSGLDYLSGTTKIYKILRNGSCKEKEDLKQLTGKIAFSYDSKWLAYHVFTNSKSAPQGHYALPPANNSANIFVKNRLNGQIYQITSYTDANALYPEFLENGDLIFLVHPHDSQKRSAFVRVRLSGLMP